MECISAGKMKFEIIKKAINDKCISDAKWIERGPYRSYEKWSYNIEHKQIESGKTYKITIEEL